MRTRSMGSATGIFWVTANHSRCTGYSVVAYTMNSCPSAASFVGNTPDGGRDPLENCSWCPDGEGRPRAGSASYRPITNDCFRRATVGIADFIAAVVVRR